MKFSQFEYKRPDIEVFKEEFNSLLNDLNNSPDFEHQYNLFNIINEKRNNFATMYKIAYVRYTLDTTNKENKDEYEHFIDIIPEYDNLMTEFNKALINSKYQEQLKKKWGGYLFTLAELEIKTFIPEIMEDLDKEMHLTTKYTDILSSAKIDFEGEERNLVGLSPFEGSVNRKTREKASQAHWNFFSENAGELDNIFDQLVKLRDGMAIKMGYKDFLELGYARMRRADYNPEMVANFRKQVEEHIVPIATKLRERQAERLGLEKLKFYDEKLYFKSGNPVPKGDYHWIINHGETMYKELSQETGEFFHFMVENELMDLVDKKGKAGGGYCTYFTSHKSPFIFSNFNGTSHDITVLTHEAGHAFQKYCCRDFEVTEYASPTSETAEIHSMSMEYLTWPWMKLFFEEDTDKFKFEHMSHSILFLPYGVAVDEFQHIIYENPGLSPEERRQVWTGLEKRYLPHRDYEGLEFLQSGGFWQSQRHIYRYPFYYIDYTLAMVCALQFWKKSNENREQAIKDYLNLCRLGGSQSFLHILDSVGLISPFEDGCLEHIVEDVEHWLEKIDDKAL